MISHSILPDALKDFDYYLHKLPMYLQQSEGFSSHFRIWYDMLVGNYSYEQTNNTGVVGIADTLFNLLNIFDITIDNNGNVLDNYLIYINSLPDSEDGTKSDFLDVLADLFAVQRSFFVSYTEAGVTKSATLHLTNAELLLLIRTQIIRNYFDGTYEQIHEYYQSIGLPVFMQTVSSAVEELYLVSISGTENYMTDNVKILFLAGLLTIQSFGIQYQYNIQDVSDAIYFKVAADETEEYLPDSKGWEDITVEPATGGRWII